MCPVAQVGAELQDLAERAKGKPFAFTEIGYSPSPLNASSEENQAAFVREMFRALTPYREEGRIAFISYHALNDCPDGTCVSYAQAQGVPPEAICSFMENLAPAVGKLTNPARRGTSLLLAPRHGPNLITLPQGVPLTSARLQK